MVQFFHVNFHLLSNKEFHKLSDLYDDKVRTNFCSFQIRSSKYVGNGKTFIVLLTIRIVRKICHRTVIGFECVGGFE